MPVPGWSAAGRSRAYRSSQFGTDKCVVEMSLPECNPGQTDCRGPRAEPSLHERHLAACTQRGSRLGLLSKKNRSLSMAILVQFIAATSIHHVSRDKKPKHSRISHQTVNEIDVPTATNNL